MSFVNVRGQRLEYECIIGADVKAPIIVFLHEGLGSVAMWRDFPSQVAARTGHSVLVYSRAGYGRSSDIRGRRSVSFMHTEALEILPDFLDKLGVVNPILFGHSDGGSIALILAGAIDRPVTGLVVVAPHVIVEDVCIDRIRQAVGAFASSDMERKLSRYHTNPKSTFCRWSEVWLDPAFSGWSIEEYLPTITCPILAIQGEDDEFGTMEQIDCIARLAPQVETLKLAKCRHSAHRDQPEAVLRAVDGFISALR